MKEALWKFYAVIFFAFFVWTTIDITLNINDLLVLACKITGVVGLAGFILKKKIARPFFWKIYFGILVFFAAIFLGIMSLGLQNEITLEYLLEFAFLVFIQAPFFYAIWKYAYGSKHIWNHGV